MIYQIMLAVIIAVYLLLGIFLLVYKPKTRLEKRKEETTIIKNSLTLKDKIDIINGRSNIKNNFFKSYLFNIKLILAKMGKTNNYPRLRLISMLFALVGLLIAVVLDNLLLAVIFVPIAALIPFEYVKYKYRKFNKDLEEELETALSMITISYNRTRSFVTSVDEVVDTLPPIIKTYFEDFLLEVTTINANIQTALINLKTRIDNKTFQQWVDRVLVCQNDKDAIPSLQNYVNEFADNRNIQNELDSEVYSAKAEMYLMMVFVFVAPAILYFLQKDAFQHLMNDTVGKITIFVSLLLVVLVYFLCSKVAKPVKFRGNRE